MPTALPMNQHVPMMVNPIPKAAASVGPSNCEVSKSTVLTHWSGLPPPSAQIGTPVALVVTFPGQ